MASKLRSVRSVLLRRKAASPGLQAAKSLDPPDPPGPPAVTPVDPEGESASRSTDRGSDLSRSEDRSSSDASAASLRPLPPGPAMTASQFAAAADEDVAARRAAAGEAAAVPRAVRDGRACQVSLSTATPPASPPPHVRERPPTQPLRCALVPPRSGRARGSPS